ncbi:hypothetical protein V1522DRAFT_425147 [Lipomyces starkeyi]
MVIPTLVEKAALEVCFVTASGQTVFAPHETFSVFAITARLDAQIEVSTSDGDSSTFNSLTMPSIGGGYYTFMTPIKMSGEPVRLKYS